MSTQKSRWNRIASSLRLIGREFKESAHYWLLTGGTTPTNQQHKKEEKVDIEHTL